MEVAFGAEDSCSALRNALLHVAPFPGELERGLDGLGSSVHGHHHVVAENLHSQPVRLF